MKQSGSKTAHYAVILLYISAFLEICWISQVLYMDTVLLELDYHSLTSFRTSLQQKSGVTWLFTGLGLTFLVYQVTEFMYHICMAIWNAGLYAKLEKTGIHQFRYGPMMAMVAWLVPGASLIMPLWVMNELQHLIMRDKGRILNRWWIMEFLPAILSVTAFICGILTGSPWIALVLYLLGRVVYFYHGMESVRIIRTMNAASVELTHSPHIPAGN